jgi:hypothetical protein
LAALAVLAVFLWRRFRRKPLAALAGGLHDACAVGADGDDATRYSESSGMPTAKG